MVTSDKKNEQNGAVAPPLAPEQQDFLPDEQTTAQNTRFQDETGRPATKFDLLKEFGANLGSVTAQISGVLKYAVVVTLLFDMLFIPALVTYQEYVLMNRTMALIPQPAPPPAGKAPADPKAQTPADTETPTKRYQDVTTATGTNITSLTNFADTLVDKVLIGIAGVLASLFGLSVGMTLNAYFKQR